MLYRTAGEISIMEDKINILHANFPEIDRLAELLESYCDFAIVFGSAITPYFNDESDIDILFCPSHETNETSIRSSIAQADFPRAIDMASAREADPIISMQALGGCVIFGRHSIQFYDFLCRTLTDYEDLKISRRPCEVALIQRIHDEYKRRCLS